MPKVSRQTKQKNLLLQEVKKFSSFFEAEQLHQKAKDKDSKIGIATVYRFLKRLKKDNQIHSYICDRKTVYSISEKNHCHFTCQKCGKIMHINIDSVDFLKKNFRGDVCHFQINLEGICDECRDNK